MDEIKVIAAILAAGRIAHSGFPSTGTVNPAETAVHFYVQTLEALTKHRAEIERAAKG